MNRSRLLLFLLILVLALPPGILTTQEAMDTRVPAAAVFAAPQHVEPAGTEPSQDARKRGDRKDKRRQDRKTERKERRERQRRSQDPEQARIEAAVEAAPPRLPALADESDPCGTGLIQLPRSSRCTHGPDAPPPADILASSSEALTPAAGRRAAANGACEGDGESGFRVQVLYIRSSSGPDNYASELGNVRGLADDANTILRNSAIAAAGQEMNFTFVVTGDCEIDVHDVVVSPSAILSFDATIIALDQQGYDRIDRIYLMFADTSAAGYCGIGTLWGDDSKNDRNFNNRGPSYSRVDRNSGCWSGYTAAHELMHNLGGVQYSAPNTSGYGHCIDEYDVMCYVDGPGVQMQVKPACNAYYQFEFLFDCQNDDYFDPDPAQQSYLDTHWNTADNWFLAGGIPDGADVTQPEITWVTPVGNGQTHVTSSGVVPLLADVFDASGVAWVEFWLFDAVADDWIDLGWDGEAPYTSSVNVSTLRSGLNYLTADAFDTEGNRVSEEIWLDRSGSVSTPSIALVSSRARMKARKRVTLTATVTNSPVSGSVVEFRLCRGGSCTWGAGQSLGVHTGPVSRTTWKANRKGQVTFLAQGTSEGGTVISNPTTVSVKKAKKKR